MPLPGNVDLIEVTGQFHFIDDTPVPTTSTVEFRPSGDPWLKDASANAILLPKTVICTVNATGQIVGPSGAVGAGGVGVKLPAVDDPDLAPNGFVYDVTVKITGLSELTYSISLPTGTTPIDLAELAPVSPVEGGGVQLVTSVNGKTPSGSGAVTLAAGDVGALDQTAGDARYLRTTYNPQKPTVTLTDQATITTDATASSLFRVTLGGNRTLAAPTGAYDGQRIQWDISQDAVGGRTLNLDPKFRFGVDIPSLALSSTPSKTDLLGAQYDAGADVWRVIALAKGY